MLALALLACAGAPSDSVADSAHAEGELQLIQLDCEGWIGESMLILGPDGTALLLDVGNDEHAGVVSEAVAARTGARQLDAVVLTHFHADHIGGLGALDLRWDRLVSRGPVHLGAVDLPDRWDESSRIDLCDADACSLPWSLDLGDGAEFTIFAADGEIGGGRAALVGSNGSYLDAPADEVIDRVRGRVEDVWATRGGSLTGDDPTLRDVQDDVVISVRDGGDEVRISGGGQ